MPKLDDNVKQNLKSIQDNITILTDTDFKGKLDIKFENEERFRSVNIEITYEEEISDLEDMSTVGQVVKISGYYDTLDWTARTFENTVAMLIAQHAID